MNLKVKLSVNEILQNKLFLNAELAAGEKGLGRLIRWVHVTEVDSIENLLSGNELLLATGIGWKQDKEVFISMVQQAIDANAAGICIELGDYITEIPPEVIHLADSHGFPLIVFTKKVRFIDITQEIHSLLIEKHYKILSDLEEYSNHLNQLLLFSNPHQKILELIHDHLKMTVVYITNNGEVQIISKKTKAEEKVLAELFKSNNMPQHMNVAHQAVQALSQTFADLFVLSETEDITEFDFLILDRSAVALAQSLLRELYIEEQRKTKEAEWVRNWLEGNNCTEQTRKYLFELNLGFELNKSSVLLCKSNNSNITNSEFNYLKVYCHSIFEQRGIYILSHVEKNQVFFILLNKWKPCDFKQRIQEGVEALKKSDFVKKQQFSQLEFSVGKFVESLEQIQNSYQTAKETMGMLEKLPHQLSTFFYEDLYIFRLVLAAQDQGILNDFIGDYLGPVIAQDRQNNGELLKTLRIYLQCKGAKKETAEQLHIVRQTLYHRLEKLYELIGRDFMDSYKRQAIEVAISAYEYLSASKPASDYGKLPKVVNSMY
ncbi:MAG: PucR family transcriptional regulator ligand-binding domain-containing protein [Chryseobacterium sp.]|nr:PucR family transcriptional regulator ligand-binding domain-containing protein [Chryseobacterium sp.]